MDRFRYQLFTRTALAGNQNRGICRGDTRDRPQYIHQSGTLPHDLIKMKFMVGIRTVQGSVCLLLLLAQFQGGSDRFQ